MLEKPKILIVDDRPQNLYLLQRVLQTLEVEVIQASSGIEAIQFLLEHDFCAAIVDVQMPEMNGYELVEVIRSKEATANLPVIFVSAIYSDEYHHRKAYDVGVVDFMSKPFVPEILINKVKLFIDMYNQRRDLQELVERLNDANQILSKRAIQIETTALIGQQVVGILDISDLFRQVVDLLQERFGYYFVGIWLLNIDHDLIRLHISNSDQVKNGKSLIVSTPKSIIARVCQTKQLHLSNNLHADRYYSVEDGLPEAQSELALPLRVQQELLGVLDIISDQLHAFDNDDITAFQIMADQIAVAIRNARLYSQVVAFKEHLEELVNDRTDELQKAYSVLEMLDKNKTDFISVAAHELRTPLTLIRGYAEMLKDVVSPIPQALVMVQGILTGENRLLEIVNSMLDISKIDSETLNVHREITSIKMIIQDVCSNLQASAKERNLQVTMSGMENLPLMRADNELMHKLFNHLVVNAIKFTPDGGRVMVQGRRVDQQSAQYVQISVSDTGVGIDSANHELIFEKFFQTGAIQFHSTGKTKFKGGGPGLGLAIARGIAKAHGGRIWVESAGYDETALPGSSFHVLLPVQIEPAM